MNELRETIEEPIFKCLPNELGEGTIESLTDNIADAILALPEIQELVRDAERWRTLPSALEEHQINYLKLVKDIDAEIAARGE